MFAPPKRSEIDHRTIKLLVGLIAIFLASLTSQFSEREIHSISASYHEGGWARDFLVGCLFAIAAFLLAYNGKSKHEMVLSKIAAISALGVALFPCSCDGHPEIIKFVHGLSAGLMFLILAGFCYIFLRRALAKGHTQAKIRAAIYMVCSITIVLVILILGIDTFTDGSISSRMPRLVFYGENIGLISFGVAWLTASRVLPVISSKDERFSPFSERAA